MPYTAPTIDEYLLKRLMPVEGVIPHLPGIEMYGDSIPADSVLRNVRSRLPFRHPNPRKLQPWFYLQRRGSPDSSLAAPGDVN